MQERGPHGRLAAVPHYQPSQLRVREQQRTNQEIEIVSEFHRRPPAAWCRPAFINPGWGTAECGVYRITGLFSNKIRCSVGVTSRGPFLPKISAFPSPRNQF